jgi:hypothetical protein
VRTPDIIGALEAAAKRGRNALVTVTAATLFLNRSKSPIAVKNSLLRFEGSTWVEAGGLMSYLTNDFDASRRTVTYIHKILPRTKPADLPVEQPTNMSSSSISKRQNRSADNPTQHAAASRQSIERIANFRSLDFGLSRRNRER